MIWVYFKLHHLDVSSVSVFLEKLLVDVLLHVLALKQHVQSDLVRGSHVDVVPEPDLVVELVVGLETNMRTVVHDRLYVVIG